MKALTTTIIFIIGFSSQANAKCNSEMKLLEVSLARVNAHSEIVQELREETRKVDRLREMPLGELLVSDQDHDHQHLKLELYEKMTSFFENTHHSSMKDYQKCMKDSGTVLTIDHITQSLDQSHIERLTQDIIYRHSLDGRYVD